MDRYRQESQEIFRIVSATGVIVEQVSVDEAYLDASNLTSETDPDAALESLLPLAQELKEAIRLQRGLTASIGIAPNKLLAKLGSDFKKPDGLTLIRDREKREFLRPLPVRALHGVGTVTEEVLHRAGLKTIGDLARRPSQAFTARFGAAFTTRLARVLGHEVMPLTPLRAPPEIVMDRVFPEPLLSLEVLNGALAELMQDACAELTRRGEGGRHFESRQLSQAYEPFAGPCRSGESGFSSVSGELLAVAGVLGSEKSLRQTLAAS